MDLEHLVPSLDIKTLLYYLWALTTLDFIIGTALAIARDKFDLALVATFLKSHVAFRVIPITATALLAHGFPPAVPEIPLLWAVVWGSSILYLGETIASIMANLPQQSANVPQATPQ